jgi:GNAT superfamily N-acetyltransferase
MITLREMRMEDIDSGLTLCRHANWNQLAADWEFFLKASPHGCRVAETESGDVVGTVTTISYEERFSWIGMVLVHPSHRRKGIGTQLLREAMLLLKNLPAIKLDATPTGREVYKRLGFKDEYEIVRMHRPPSPGRATITTTSVRPMSEKDLAEIYNLDRSVFGADRRFLLHQMLLRSTDYNFVIKNKAKVTGFCLGRPGFNFDHIGPIVAESVGDANMLLSAALSKASEKAVIVDASQHSVQWNNILTDIGFKQSRPFIRMYSGSNSYAGLPENQFAILGPEFG